jgi:predicted methyltransferase
MKTLQHSVLKALALCAFAALAQAALAQAISVPDYIQGAVDSTARAEAMKARDAKRHPGEMLALSGIKPGDHVVEFAGFGQYYTTMLTEIVGPEGHVDVYDLPYTDRFAGEPSRAFAAAHANVTYHQVDYNAIELPQDVDIVYNVLYYHDLPINKIDTAALNKKIFAALKPGGVFFVIDHNAAPGSGMRDTEKLHRIDPEVIRKEVTDAGFRLEATSDLLKQEADARSGQISFAEGLRDTSDQSVFKFVKP